ncbi:MAG: ArsR family transcriptional regulator [Promethearchaeota archaeon]
MNSNEEFNELKKLLIEQQNQIRQLQNELTHLKSSEIEVNSHPSKSAKSKVTTSSSFDQLGQMIENYVEGILTSVQDSIEGALDGVLRFGCESDHQEARLQRKMERFARKMEIKRNKFLQKWGVTPEEYDNFFSEGAKLTGLLADKNRLKLLKLLETGPKYQKDLSDETGVAGGSFKHHMDQLREEGFVIQEAVRGRYLITQLGREALKLSEILWLRKLKMEKSAEMEDIHEETDVFDSREETSNHMFGSEDESEEE